MDSIDDPSRGRLGGENVRYYAEGLQRSAQFREDYAARLRLIGAEDMPFEDSPDGKLKHIINEAMETAETCVDAYMQFLDSGGASGRHRHLSEEIVFILEGEGHDLHWDVKFECEEEFHWEWDEEPKKYPWKAGDFVYVPPYCIHQHFAGANGPARFICVTSRIVKAMGFDWFDQLEPAPGYEEK
ncbi:MAG: hypothetical protein QGF09_03260 [Rhodospirillales bacterium]|jgi:gentisate 1,2-dioxygenase|nr:hypothetical protein [Rhodospirillales bacterium]